jgi:hypothetical protein
MVRAFARAWRRCWRRCACARGRVREHRNPQQTHSKIKSLGAFEVGVPTHSRPVVPEIKKTLNSGILEALASASAPSYEYEAGAASAH